MSRSQKDDKNTGGRGLPSLASAAEQLLMTNVDYIGIRLGVVPSAVAPLRPLRHCVCKNRLQNLQVWKMLRALEIRSVFPLGEHQPGGMVLLGVAMANMRYEFAEQDLLVLVHNEHPPSEEEWNSWLAFNREEIPRRGSYDILIFSLGGGPNAQQRTAAAPLGKLPVRPTRVALMTTSPVARGILTALSWLGLSDLRAFPFDGVAAGLAHVRHVLDADTVRRVRDRMLRALTPNEQAARGR